MKISNVMMDSSVLEMFSSVLGNNMWVGWSEGTTLRAVNLLVHLVTK